MLTNTKIKAAKAKDKNYNLSDTDGLFLLITPKNKKLWRYRYTFNRKRNCISLGSYPSTSLAEARTLRNEYEKNIEKGISPIIAKQQEKQRQAYTFTQLLMEWHEYHYKDLSRSTSNRALRNLETYLTPWLGSMSITDITPPILLQCLRRVESTGKLETASKLKQLCGQAFRYGVANGHCERDITQDLRGALKTKPAKHMPTLSSPQEVSKLLQDIERYSGSFIVKSALMLSPFVFVRPKELSTAKWADINFDTKEWLIPAENMKMNAPHLIPLCKQAIEILRELHPLTGSGTYVFQGVRKPTDPMNSASVNAALKRLGYKGKIVSHGFRGMASTMLNEHGFRYDVIERQLAHQERNAVRNAYNHAQYINERKEMMVWWGNYLEHLKNQSNVIPFKQEVA